MNRLVRWLSHPRVVVTAQTLTALAFLAAALAKIGDAATFARQIHHFRLVPFGLENLAAITLPWIELVLALAILSRLRPRAGSAVGLALMTVFVLAVVAAVARRLDIECGCFGTADATRVGAAKLIENLGLTALAGIGCLTPRLPAAPDGVNPSRPPRATPVP
jgi:uncharacterized membrane protein YphA (DoxX/SURF4 family)